MNRLLQAKAAKPLLFAVCLLPLAWLVWGAVANTLGANPAEALIRSTGDWTLRFLCLTLTVTPLRQWSGLPALLRFRRMLGLFAFFYASLHFLAYGWLDKGLDLGGVARVSQVQLTQVFLTMMFAALLLGEKVTWLMLGFAVAVVATVADPAVFKSGRNLAAWVGLVPRQNSSGGKERLGGITKQGDRYLRQLLVIGALAVVRFAVRNGTRRPWLVQLLYRRTPKVAAVALANKNARMVWAIMTSGERYREPLAA